MNAYLIKKIKVYFHFLNWDILIILLLGLLSIFWFKGSNLIHGGDFGMPLDWVKYLKNMFSVWVEDYSTGRSDYRNLASIVPYALVGAFFQKIGLSLPSIEKIFFYSWFAGSGISMYILCGILGMKRIGKLVASVIYMLNPFSLVIIWRVSHGLIQMPYAFAPLILGLYIYGIIKKKSFKYVLTFCLLWLFLTGSAYANPRSAIMHWIPVFFYFIYYYLAFKKERKHTIIFTLEILGVWIFFNLYWIFPFLANVQESNADAHSPFLMPDLEEVKLTSVKFFEAIRMLGYWSLKSGYKGEPYYPYWEYYSKPWVNLISWLIPIFTAIGFLSKEIKKDSIKYFYLALLIFGLIGINGANPPVGKFILTIYKIIPPLILLSRFNFLFFGLPTYLIFAVLIGYGFTAFYEFGKEKIDKLIILPIVVSIFCLCVVLVWPFWNGEVIRSETKLLPGERTKVPLYWKEAGEWLKTGNDFFRIFPLPMGKTYNSAYFWGEGYSGGDLTRWLLPRPVLNVNTGDTFKIPMVIGEAIEINSNSKNLTNLLGFLNVKYIMVKNDTRWDFLKWHDSSFNHFPQNIKEFAGKQNNLTLEKKIGELNFYRISDDLVLPRIYSPKTIVAINGDYKSLIDISPFLSPDNMEAFFINPQGNTLEASYYWQLPRLIKKEGINNLENPEYQFNIQKEGEYDVLLRDADFLKDFEKKNEIRFSINNSEIKTAQLVKRNDNLYLLGKEKLVTGENIISLFLPPILNLAPKELPQTFNLISGKQEMITIPATSYSLGETYQFSFVTKNLQGTSPLAVVWQNFIDSPSPVFEQDTNRFFASDIKTSFNASEVPLDANFKYYEFPFGPHPLSKYFGITLVSRPPASGISENTFNEVKIQRIFNNPLLLSRNNKQLFNPPRISFEQINPAKYKVSIIDAKEPFWLVFSESYHSKWEISVDAKHEVINGFANGWFINKLGSYEIEIYFKPQNHLIIGLVVSLFCVVLSLFYILFNILLKSKHVKLIK